MNLKVVNLPNTRARLKELEGVIDRSRKTFVEIGEALAEIQDQQLYKSEAPTFEKYCSARFGMARIRAYQFIEAVKVVNNVLTMVNTLPSSERVVRPLVRLKPEEQREAWNEVCKCFEKPTAKNVTSIVNKKYPRDDAAKKPKIFGNRIVLLLDNLPRAVSGLSVALTFNDLQLFAELLSKKIARLTKFHNERKQKTSG